MLSKQNRTLNQQRKAHFCTAEWMEGTVEARHEHNLHHVIAHMQTICTVQSVWLESVGFYA